MNKALQLVASDFPRTPALLFSGWILFLVISDLWEAFGFISEPPTAEENETQKTVIHFVKFQTIELDNFSIMVGTQYKANDGSAPEKQWCYADMASSEGSHRINIGLADKEEKRPAVYQKISQASASKLGLSSSEVKKIAKTHCNFL